MKRPISFTVYNIIVWVTKFIPLAVVYSFFDYINPRIDFYLGLNLRDIRDYLYVYVVTSFLTIITTVFLFFRRKNALPIYYFLKTVEVHCLIMSLPTLVYGWERALNVQYGFIFHLSAWTFVLSTNLIFPLIYYSFKKQYK